MPLGRSVARFNRRVTNHITGPLAPVLPGFGVIIHTGRTSGAEYRTPVTVFRDDDGYVVALTYGARADWVRNVLTAGGCELATRGRRITLREPEIVTGDRAPTLPLPVRLVLRDIKVTEYLRLRDARPGR